MTEIFLLFKNNPLVVLLIGFMAWFIGFLLHKLIKKDISLLKKDISSLATVIEKDNRNVENKMDSFKELLSEKLKPIEKQLSNHVSDTDKKIEKLAEGQARLEGKIDKILEDKK